MTQPLQIHQVLEYRKPPEVIREIARNQRLMLWCIFALICLYLALFGIAFSQASFNPIFRVPEAIVFAILLAIAATTLASVVFSFFLSIRLFGLAVGILIGLLVLLPVLGLLALGYVDSRATDVLKKAGLKVGLLGVQSVNCL